MARNTPKTTARAFSGRKTKAYAARIEVNSWATVIAVAVIAELAYCRNSGMVSTAPEKFRPVTECGTNAVG